MSRVDLLPQLMGQEHTSPPLEFLLYLCIAATESWVGALVCPPQPAICLQHCTLLASPDPAATVPALDEAAVGSPDGDGWSGGKRFWAIHCLPGGAQVKLEGGAKANSLRIFSRQ